MPSGSGADFNYVAYATEDFENKYASSKLRIEKLDAQTGENKPFRRTVQNLRFKRAVEKTGAALQAAAGRCCLAKPWICTATGWWTLRESRCCTPEWGQSMEATATCLSAWTGRGFPVR